MERKITSNKKENGNLNTKQIEAIIRSCDLDLLLDISKDISKNGAQDIKIEWDLNYDFQALAGVIPKSGNTILLTFNPGKILIDFNKALIQKREINFKEYILSIACHEFAHISTYPRRIDSDIVEIKSGLDYRIIDERRKVSVQSGAIVNEGITDFFGSIIFDRYVKLKKIENNRYLNQYGIIKNLVFGLFTLISKYTKVPENIIQQTFFNSFFNSENLDIFSVYDIEDKEIESILRSFLSSSYEEVNHKFIDKLKQDLDNALERNF